MSLSKIEMAIKPLRDAINEGNMEKFMEKLGALADLDTLLGSDVKDSKESKEIEEALQSLLFLAIEKRLPEFVEMLATTVKVNVYDKWGRTPLDYAIKSGDPRLVKFLIANGANVNLKSTRSGGILKISPLSRALQFLWAENASSMLSSFRVKGVMKETLVALINAGANLRENYSNDLRYPIGVHIAQRIRLRDLPGLDPKFEREIRDIQDICLDGHRRHLQGIMRYKRYRIRLEGLSLGLASSTLLDSFRQYVNSNPKELNEWMNTVLGAKLDFSDAHNDPNNILKAVLKDMERIDVPLPEKTALELLKTNQVVPIPLLTTIYESGDHAQTYLFYDHFVMRVNCGGTVDKTPNPYGIRIYQIGNMEAVKKHLPQFINSQVTPLSDKYLLEDFVKDCQLRERERIPLDSQTVGNCCWVSSLGLLHANILMETYKKLVEREPDRYERDPESGLQYWELCWKKAKTEADKFMKSFIAADLKSSTEALAARDLKSQVVPEDMAHIDQWTRSRDSGSIRVANSAFNALLNAALEDKETRELYRSMSFTTEAEKNAALNALVAENVGAAYVQHNVGEDAIFVFEDARDIRFLSKKVIEVLNETEKKGTLEATQAVQPPTILVRQVSTKIRSFERYVPEEDFHLMLKNRLAVESPKKRMRLLLHEQESSGPKQVAEQREAKARVEAQSAPYQARIQQSADMYSLRANTLEAFGLEDIRRGDEERYLLTFTNPDAAKSFDRELQSAKMQAKIAETNRQPERHFQVM